MEILFPLVLAVVGSSGIASVVVAVLNHYWSSNSEQDKRLQAIIRAQRVLMVDRVQYLGKTYIRAGYIDIDDKNNLHQMYLAYKDLGGNGDLETIVAEVNRLPVRG